MRAPAKINLHLGVGRPREDGFHPLDTVFQAVGLYDDVRATDGDGTVTVEPASYLPASVLDDLASPDGNIVTLAARLLAATAVAPDELPLVDLLVEKRIPVAGGMAGGSADAAATLVALDRLWDLGTPDDMLLELAAALGSDVPFSLLGGTAHGTGRGDVLHAIPDPTTWWWVVVPSPEGLATPSVYRRFDEMFPDAPATPASSAGTLAALAAGDPDRLAAALHNDLEAPAHRPAPGPRRPDRPRRGRGRPARHRVGLRARRWPSSAGRATTRAPWPTLSRATTCPSSWSPTAPWRARTSSHESA